MGFDRPTLDELKERIYEDQATRFNPISKTPRYNLLKVLAYVDAGKFHQLNGDLEYLSKQIFPDTAEGKYLRAHWSDRVAPNYASVATGSVVFTGTDGVSVPTGLLLTSDAGQVYYVESQVTVASGTATATVKAQEAGSDANLSAGASLTISSTVPSGLSSSATVGTGGIAGGVDAESDSTYLTRVLNYIRTGNRYGKPGDFAAWAVDSSSTVSKGFEVKNYGPLGALLIQVIGGNQTDGVTQVGNIDTVADYIAAVAPPIVFTVKTPELVELNPSIALLAGEDTEANRTTALSLMKQYLEITAKPGCTITAGGLRDSFVDGTTITDATVTLTGGNKVCTVLQYPVLGTPTWVS
jgi:hypothetical protein